MGAVTLFLGGLLCRMPLGIDQCHSQSGIASLGGWAMIASLGTASMLVLMRNPRR
jgi:hypothetical protein